MVARLADEVPEEPEQEADGEAVGEKKLDYRKWDGQHGVLQTAPALRPAQTQETPERINGAETARNSGANLM